MLDNKWKIFRSHPSFVEVQLGSHKLRYLVTFSLFIVAHGSGAWFLHFLVWSDGISIHWVEILYESNVLNNWPESPKVPLCVRRRCPYILPQHYALAYAVLGNHSWGPWMWPRSSPYFESELERKEIPSLGDALTTCLSRDQRDGKIWGCLWYPI